MKMHITHEELKQLDEKQKRALTELWKPAKYDVAVASICMDVENEIYDEFEFVVGHVVVDKYSNIYIHDIRNVPVDSNENNEVSKNESFDDEGKLNLYNANESRNTQSTTGLFSTAVKNLEIPFADSSDEDSYEEDYEDEEIDEEDFDISYTRPGFFNKEDCIPLLNIGQMIELLQRLDFGSADFFLHAGTGENGCEIGRSPSTWVDYSYGEREELCDVLWIMVKMALG